MLLGNGAYGSRSEFVKIGSQTKVFKGVLGCSLGDLCGAEEREKLDNFTSSPILGTSMLV